MKSGFVLVPSYGFSESWILEMVINLCCNFQRCILVILPNNSCKNPTVPVRQLSFSSRVLLQCGDFSFIFKCCHCFRESTPCYVVFWPFDPAKNAIPRWCTGKRWHILMAVMRGHHVGGNWLMKWDELKNFPWYTHRLMHRKRVTCELHGSYFRLMTIKHSISKIKWAIVLALNYYITQSRRKSRASWVEDRTEL